MGIALPEGRVLARIKRNTIFRFKFFGMLISGMNFIGVLFLQAIG